MTPPEEPSKAGRATATGISLAMQGIGGNLALASTVTLGLLGGMVFALFVALVFVLGSENPGLGLLIAIVLTVLFNTVVFFLSPFLMDLTQRWLYGTRAPAMLPWPPAPPRGYSLITSAISLLAE